MGSFTKEDLLQIKEYCKQVLEAFLQKPISIKLVWVMVIYLGQYILYANSEVSDKNESLLMTGEKNNIQIAVPYYSM